MTLTKKQKQKLFKIINEDVLCVFDFLRQLKVGSDIEDNFDRLCANDWDCVKCFKEFFKLIDWEETNDCS